MRTEPEFGTGNNLVEPFRLCVALQLRLALLLVHPQDGIVRVAVYDLVAYALLVHKRKGVDNSQELTYIVGSLHRSETKHLRAGGEVYAPVLHRTRIAGACRVDGPRIAFYSHGQRKHGVMAP